MVFEVISTVVQVVIDGVKYII